MRWWLLILLGCAALPAIAQEEGDAGTILACARLDSLAISVDGRVTGLAWLGGDTLAVLFVRDDSPTASGRPESRLVLQDRRGSVLRNEDVTGVLTSGLAWDGRYLWSCGDTDGGGALLHRIEPRLLTVDASFPTPGHRPSGLCADGRFIWLTDRDAGRLERFDPQIGGFTRVTATPGFSPAGLAWDGRRLWVADVGTGRLYRLSGSRRAWSGTVAASAFLHRGRPVQLAHDGRDLWFIAEGRRWLVRVRIS